MRSWPKAPDRRQRWECRGSSSAAPPSTDRRRTINSAVDMPLLGLPPPDQPTTTLAMTLIVVARMTVPNAYDSKQWRSTTTRIVRLETSVSDTW